jgi:hypothetical protein
MPLLDRIKSNFAEEMVTHCSERSCKLKLVGLSNYVVLKGEKMRGDCKRYDIIPKKCGLSFLDLISRLK